MLRFIQMFVILSFASEISASENAVEALTHGKEFQKKYDHCELAYFTEMASSNVPETERERFTGGFSGYESWQNRSRFLLASNEPLRVANETQVLREGAVLDLANFRFVTLSNEKYQARVEKGLGKAYVLRGEFPLGKFVVGPQHSVRCLFAPDFDEWISNPAKLKFVKNTSFGKTPCHSVEFERRIPEDDPPSWERRTVYFDVTNSKCLGHKTVYSDSEEFETPSATEEYLIEYGQDGLPIKIVRTRSGKYEFTQTYEFSAIKLRRQPDERFFLPYYGLDESNHKADRISFGTVLVAVGVVLIGVSLVTKWARRQK
jgi:hypothetical protein